MTDVFEGTGAKRYVIRRRENSYSQWEYPPALQYDTLEEARTAIAAIKLSGGCEIAELYPCVQYKPGAEYRDAPLLRSLLEHTGMKPYVVQRLDRLGSWETCMDRQYDTPDEASAGAAAAGGTCRVAAAALTVRYEPVKGA